MFYFRYVAVTILTYIINFSNFTLDPLYSFIIIFSFFIFIFFIILTDLSPTITAYNCVYLNVMVWYFGLNGGGGGLNFLVICQHRATSISNIKLLISYSINHKIILTINTHTLVSKRNQHLDFLIARINKQHTFLLDYY